MSVQETTATSLTPTVRSLARRSVFWLVLAAIAAAVAIVSAIAAGSGPTGEPLGADNPAPVGAQALVKVLGAHGVTVVAADTFAEATAAGGKQATVLVYDPSALLSAEQLQQLKAKNLVLVAPGKSALDALAGGVSAATRNLPADTVAAGCSLPAAQRSGDILAGGSAYRVPDTFTGCFPRGDGRYSLATGPRSGSQAGTGTVTTVTVLGAAAVLRNESIINAGNAALAVALLGAEPTLVWYLPSLADVPSSGPPSLGELTPGWVTPVLVLLVAVAAAAAFWRGRRFGPLVAENLPVVVKARETMEGRARLYQRSSARLHALDALRIGAAGRLATLTGLPRSATIGEIADAVARLTGRHPDELRGILLDASPASDGELARLSQQLTDLEIATTRAIHQEE